MTGRCINSVLFLLASVAVLGPCAHADEGIYAPVALRGKERNDLIETADQFHAQFERRSLL
jgi:hypothetical protein